MNIGLSIKSIRKKLNKDQTELAKQCGISQTSLSQIETGLKRPSRRTINKLCKALEIPEGVIYIMAMQENDISPAKRHIYQSVFPSLSRLALLIVKPDLQDLMNRHLGSR